jgi:hypothetical protein
LVLLIWKYLYLVLRAQLRHNNLNSVTQFVSGLNKSFGAFREFLSKSASNILEFKSDSRKIIFYIDAKLDYESALIQDDNWWLHSAEPPEFDPGEN